MKNIFITFEGIEACGKSTQSKCLLSRLENENLEVILTREPGGTKISEKIRDILLDSENVEMLPETELLLYMASRSQHTGEKIIPFLKKGIVICDRYYDSSLVYQGIARNLDLKVLKEITQFATYDLKPDITFLIDLPAEVGLSRIEQGKADRIEKESIEFHKSVRKGFLELAKLESDRIIILDGNKTINQIQNEIINILNKRFKGIL